METARIDNDVYEVLESELENLSKLTHLRGRMEKDLLENILPFWMKYTQDEEQGGFYGAVGLDKRPVPNAPKSLVLNARLLWTFAGAYRIFGKPGYLELADRAYNYIVGHFWDDSKGGGYWMLHADGTVADSTKMVYAQGFLLYAFSEYARATGREEALRYADKTYEFLEGSCREGGHYLETAKGCGAGNGAVAKEGLLSMNTHIHILEPVTCYFRVRHTPQVEETLVNLIEVTGRKIYSRRLHHFQLFFTEDMNPLPGEISYGHDIEGSWLLTEAAEVLCSYAGNRERAEALRAETREIAVDMVDYVLAHGVDRKNGGVYDAGDEDGKIVSPQKVWWSQAEAVVGCVNAWEITGEERYLDEALALWDYIEKNVANPPEGDWLGTGRDSVRDGNSGVLAGAWKCPYHNSRAAFEICERADKRA